MTGAEALIEQGKAQGIEQGIQQGIEQGKAEGKAEGMQQGIEQGEIRAKQAYIIKSMQLKFDDVSEYMVNQINAIKDISKLDDLLEQVLTANTIEEVEVPK